MKNLRLVQQNINPQLRLNGIVMTMFDSRTRLADQVVAEVRAHFGPTMYETVIPRSVRLSEAPGFGQPISRYDPGSKGALAYRQLAEEFAGRPIADHGWGLGRPGPVRPRAAPARRAGPTPGAQDDPSESPPVIAVPAPDVSGPRPDPTPDRGARSESSMIQRPDPAGDRAPRPRRWWPFRRSRRGGSR